MNCTSIEQSKKLLELGLSPESADMIHICSIIRGKENGFLDVVPKESILCAIHTTIEEKEKSIPCWSLGALLELMPKDIILERSGYKYNHRLYLTYNYEAEKWTVLYSNKIWDDIVFFGKTSTDAAYNIVVWLLENNYIKKEGNT